MGIWPFRRKKQEEESYFASTGGATVVPAAAPGELITSTASVRQPAASPAAPSTEPSQRELDAQQGPAPEGPPGVPPAVLEMLRSAGIELDKDAQVHVSTQTAQWSGTDAMQALSQLGTVFRQMGSQMATMQVHPGVQIFANGVLQESPDQLKTTGVDAQVTVKDLEEKHVAFGDTHIVKLKLEVTKPGAPPYEVYTGAIVPAKVTEEFAEGKTFKAKVDPNDPHQVVVLWDGA